MVFTGVAALYGSSPAFSMHGQPGSNLFNQPIRYFMTPSHTTAPLVRLLRYGHLFRSRIWLATLYSILNKLFDLAPPC